MDSEDIRTLEQVRQRLVTIEGNIRQLHQQFHLAQVEQSLPSWNQIITIQKSVATQLKLLQEIIGNEEKAHFLRSAHVFPTPLCPWGQENTISHLLRKRLEPDISTWANRARVLGARLERGEVCDGGSSGMSKEDWNELWEWAAPEANGIVKKVLGLAGDESDDEENANVEDEGADNEAEDESKMKGAAAVSAVRPMLGQAMPLDQMLRVAVAGGAQVRSR